MIKVELTSQEARFILQSMDAVFNMGVGGGMSNVAKVLQLARSIESKLNVVQAEDIEIETKKSLESD